MRCTNLISIKYVFRTPVKKDVMKHLLELTKCVLFFILKIYMIHILKIKMINLKGKEHGYYDN